MIALAQMRLPLAALAACALMSLGACGQKGALYLPDPAPRAVPAAPAAPAPATEPPAGEATRGKAPRLPDPATAQ